MNKPLSKPADPWALIEKEKESERSLRRVARTAWIVAFIVMGVFVVTTLVQVIEMARAAMLGAVPWATAMALATPLLTQLGILSVLVATLSTIGMFTRLRAASLAEIQLRLAALEEMLTSTPDARRSPLE